MEKKVNYTPAVGKRKRAIVKIFLQTGKGYITVNKITFKQYFKNIALQELILKPLKLVKMLKFFDIKIQASGGGMKGQASSIKLGISNALIKYDNNINIKNNYKKLLRNAGCVTRDSRIVERKKFGYKKARKKEQYSKR